MMRQILMMICIFFAAAFVVMKAKADTPPPQRLSIIKTPLTPASPTSFTAGIASASAVAANTNRKGLTIVNVSVNTISIGFGVAGVLNSGITLFPGGVFVMDEYTFNQSAVNIIASAASSVVSIQEFN